MTYEDQIQAVCAILERYTYPKDQFGFVTERQVCEEILAAAGIYP